MHIFVISPKEDESITAILIAQKGDTPASVFEKEWNNTINRLNELEQDWQVDDIIKIMEAKGWKIIVPDHTRLTY